MEKEKIILVNKNNRKIGEEGKIKAHKEGKLHRAFSIFVFNSKGELLIQQRSTLKYHCGGIWANTCCSHPRPGETYAKAIHRRLKEEMGFDCKLKRLFCFIYRVKFENGLTENEHDSVFIGDFSGEPEPNLEEVANYKWISIRNLKKDLKRNPNKYAVWFKMALDKMEDNLLI